MTMSDNKGGRSIELYLPFEHDGKQITKVEFQPITLGHMLAWQEGEYKSSMTLMTQLAKMDDFAMRLLRIPDADRVMSAFMDMLPATMRDDVQNGRVPTKQGAPIMEAPPEHKEDDLDLANPPDEADFDLEDK